MANSFFQFKQFTVYHDRCAMKVTTDACLFGAWIAGSMSNRQQETGNGQNARQRMLDIGTGTGLLSLMVAQANDTLIDAVEIDPAAAEQAKENIAASRWKEQIQVINGDVLHLPLHPAYDVIFSNPPFYENEIRSEKEEKNKAHHDAGLKLTGLLPIIKKNLQKDGVFYLLLPAKRKAEIETLLKKHHLFPEVVVLVQPSLKHPAFRLMIQGRHQPVETIQERVMIIKDNNDAYTPDFTQRLRPYYLYL